MPTRFHVQQQNFRRRLLSALLSKNARFHGQLVDLANISDEDVDIELNRRGLNPNWLLNEFTDTIDTIHDRISFYVETHNILGDILEMDDEEVDVALKKEGLNDTVLLETFLYKATEGDATEAFLKTKSGSLLCEIIALSDEEVDEQIVHLGVNVSSLADDFKEQMW